MSQKQDILKLLKKRKNLSTAQISKMLHIKSSSVRSALNRLKKEKQIKKGKVGVTTVNSITKKGKKQLKKPKKRKTRKDKGKKKNIWRRKIVKTVLYCSGHQKSYFAITYERNKQDRFNELFSELESTTENFCSPIDNELGYDDQKLVSKDNAEPKYPKIDVDAE